ncbi:MAG: MBL fold metallo-hydrolase, partial [Candidatus Aenigmatarchaeota archaeon]
MVIIIEIEFLGGAQEVGRSSVSITDGRTNIILDCGAKIEKTPPEYPLETFDPTAIILSHAHLDHCGAIPSLFRKGNPRFITNDISLDLVIMLLKDSMKIASFEDYELPFGKKEAKHAINSAILSNYNEKFRIDNFRCTLFDAGHIPGSCGIQLQHDKGNIFYTGDIKLNDTRLLHGCNLPSKTDILITESTYSEIDHTDRKREEENLVKSVEEALKLGEKTIIPVFAIGRGPEVLLILEEYADQIALDGMAKLATEITLNYASYVRDPIRLKKIMKKVFWVRSQKDRVKASEKFPIVVTTAGMMSGGPVLYYLRNIRGRPEAKILFTGYLMEDSPAKILLETGFFKSIEEQYHVRCDVKQFDLSAHAGRSELFEIIKRLQPKQIIAMHGENCPKFAKDLEEKFNISTIAPKNGDV